MNVVSTWFKQTGSIIAEWFVETFATIGKWYSDVAATVKAVFRLLNGKFRIVRRKVLFHRYVRESLYWLQHVPMPGSKGVPIYDVLSYFLTGIFNGSLTGRAKGLAFSFLTALPPLLIFFFSLVAYFPVDGLQNELLAELSGIVPEKILEPLEKTINDVMGHRHSTLLSVGFVGSIILAANGVNGMIYSLNFANQWVEKRPYLQRYLLCVLMVFVIYVLVVLVLSLLIGHKYLLQLIFSQGWLSNTSANTLMFNIGRWILLSLATLFTVSLIYYWAPAKKQRVGFLSPGSVMATIMFFILSWALGIYLNNFSRYNLLYGSIGTLLMIMFWVYFNCIVLLIGYELNISIYNGSLKKKTRESRKMIKQRIQILKDDNTEKQRQSADRRQHK